MKNEEFEVLAKFHHSSRSKKAARMVMVDGLKPVDAATLQGLSASAVSDTLTRIRRNHAWAMIASRIKLSGER